MTSPAPKRQCAEDHNTAFVPPPVFRLPVRPPPKGFPSESEIVIAEAQSGKRSCGILGKALLLDASPTLEFPVEEADAFLSSLRQHPKCASIREQLTAINDVYLNEIFGEEDAREDDTRRRVDYNAASAILKSNSSKRLSMCVSCLTRGQHRHYRPWMLKYMQTGIIPKTTDEYPDMSIVLDLVQREQTAYLHKFMEEIISCEACNIEAGYRKRSMDSEEILVTHRACWNHNYINEHVENFAKRWWYYRLQSRVQQLFHNVEVSDANTLHKVVWDLKKSVSRTTTTTNTSTTNSSSSASASSSSSAGVKPVAGLSTRTHQLANRHIDETVAMRESCGMPKLFSAIPIPPSFPLMVQQLDDRPPRLYPVACSDDNNGNNNNNNNNDRQQLEKKKIENALPPTVPSDTAIGVSYTLRLCKSALLELATAHVSSYRASFRIPFRCVWNSVECRLDIYVEKPLPGEQESRRNINSAAFKRLVDDDPRLPSNGRSSRRDCGESKCYTEVSLGKDMAFQCVSNCTYDINGKHPVFRMIKMEYNCKGYNTIPDDIKTFHYERFSKREVVRMLVLLHCNPTAVIYVYRINAYTSAVIGIEQFSQISFTTQVMGSLSHDLEVQRTWACLRDVLKNVVSFLVQQTQKQRQEQKEDSTTVTSSTYILVKEKQNSELTFCSVNACYPNHQDHNHEESKRTAEDESFIEASSRAVCRREYLPPCVWPFPDRIPYTYAPLPKKCFAVNRTTETRHDSEYYAKHDVWEQKSHYYTVGEDGIIREWLPEDS
ncbi:hypothetical protein LSM04_005790 [Trypanosoma melophagium]|uniref:uncharacterized protein n=1 Tax=Trypanosoma melophagium TaxID=715481 RepID=UPI00351A0D8A|nr:hypothetical protein LSM04_005790 [Trypanosoma melophagium]